MKKIVIILISVFALTVVNAQERLVNLPSQQVKGDTIIFEPNYSLTFKGAEKYAGIVGFQFTKTDVADSASFIRMEGSLDGTVWTALTGATERLTNTTTNGTTYLYTATPLYVKYRLYVGAATGDTVNFTGVKYIIKLP